MNLSRAAAIVIGLFAALPAFPAAAAEPVAGLSLTVSQRWEMSSTQGAWTPYVVTVRNDGPSDFSGEVWLLPSDRRQAPATAFPAHRTRLSVARGTERSATLYVVDGPNGYRAELRDENGRVLANEEMRSIVHSSSSLGVLSDVVQADQKIAVPLRATSRVDPSVARFPSAPAFPASAVQLAGLSGVVIDQFDTAGLSPAQTQSLRDFVGLGGSLILAGGPSWRRSLLPLPPELLPLRPSATVTAGLGALADLGGRTTELVAQIAGGENRGRVVLASREGVPLVVEAGYGAGRIVEMTFDPFAEPFDREAGLAGLAWAQAISRALGGLPGASRAVPQAVRAGGTSESGGGAAIGGWAPGFSSGAENLVQLLQDTPAAATPPVGLLGGLLVAYVLLAGLLNYLVLKATGRRGLMWVTTPMIAIAFTVAAYGVGFGTRGSDFFDNEVQIQRLGPDGVVETYSYHGIFSPHKGDFSVQLPAGTLASTALIPGGFGSGADQAVVTAGARPAVRISGVGIWTMKTVQSLSVAHPAAGEQGSKAMPIEAHLQLVGGHYRGSIANRGPLTVRGLRLVGAGGGEALLAGALPPGASLKVDAEITSPLVGPTARPGAPGAPSSRDVVLRLAAAETLTGHPGELALVGLGEGRPSLEIDGARPSHSVVAAIVEPVRLEAVDRVTAAWPRPRLVSTALAEAGMLVNVFDTDLPAGPPDRQLDLAYTFLPGQPSVRSVEVYDWATATWRGLNRQPAPPGSTQSASRLAAGEVSTGIARVRIEEAGFNLANLSYSQP